MQIFEINEIKTKLSELTEPMARLNVELAIQLSEGMEDPVFVKEGTALRVLERDQAVEI